jgi:plastocyanin
LISPVLPLFAIVLGLLCAPGVARADATVEGTVAIPPRRTGTDPAPRYTGGSTYVAGDPDPPAAVVYVDVPGGKPPAHHASLAQHHYQFAPGLLAVQRGTVVEFPNLDDEYHSVFSYSKAKRFDLGRYARDEKPAALTFDETGVVKLYCEIHDHMRGTIVVLDTPYFVKTEPDGRYRLGGLPSGRHVLRAWVDDGPPREQTVELRDGETLRVDFPGQ